MKLSFDELEHLLRVHQAQPSPASNSLYVWRDDSGEIIYESTCLQPNLERLLRMMKVSNEDEVSGREVCWLSQWHNSKAYPVRFGYFRMGDYKKQELPPETLKAIKKLKMELF